MRSFVWDRTRLRNKGLSACVRLHLLYCTSNRSNTFGQQTPHRIITKNKVKYVERQCGQPSTLHGQRRTPGSGRRGHVNRGRKIVQSTATAVNKYKPAPSDVTALVRQYGRPGSRVKKRGGSGRRARNERVGTSKERAAIMTLEKLPPSKSTIPQPSPAVQQA